MTIYPFGSNKSFFYLANEFYIVYAPGPGKLLVFQISRVAVLLKGAVFWS
jgi:hypothetical protein